MLVTQRKNHPHILSMVSLRKMSAKENSHPRTNEASDASRDQHMVFWFPSYFLTFAHKKKTPRPFAYVMMSSGPEQEITLSEQLFQRARLSFGQGIPDVDSLIHFAVALIPQVQRIAAPGQGAAKKAALLAVVERLLDEVVLWPDSVEGDNMKTQFKALAQTVLPPVIDTAVDVARGKIDLAKHVHSATSGAVRLLTRIGAACCPGRSARS